jgi:hypothetical protein
MDRSLAIKKFADCLMCLSGNEDVRHMMFTRDRAKLAWTSLVVWSQTTTGLIHDRSGASDEKKKLFIRNPWP